MGRRPLGLEVVGVLPPGFWMFAQAVSSLNLPESSGPETPKPRVKCSVSLIED